MVRACTSSTEETEAGGGCPRSGCEHRKLGPILGRQLLSISSFPTDLTCQIHMGSQMANLSADSWSGGWAHPFPQQVGASLEGGIIPTTGEKDEVQKKVSTTR